MNIKPIFLSFIFAIKAYSNPIMVDEGTTAKKISESCLIFLNKESLNVSCKIEYKIVDRSTPDIRIYVPVYCSPDQYQEIDKTKKFIAASIESEGISYSPLGVFSFEVDEKGRPFPDDAGPDSKVKVGCEFLIKTPKSDRFTILVTYTQPLINGVAYYLPLFEKNSDPVNLTNFEITFFTTSEFKVNLVTQHPKRSKITSHRIAVRPKDRELIAVEIKDDKTVENASEK